MGNGHDAVFLSRNYGRGPGSLDLGPHVARVVGPVRQHGLVGAQVAHEQARRLRASPACPPVRARVQMRPFAAHPRGSLVVKPARLRPGAYPQGLPFFGPRRHLVRLHGRGIEHQLVQAGGVLHLRQYVEPAPGLPPAATPGVDRMPRVELFDEQIAPRHAANTPARVRPPQTGTWLRPSCPTSVPAPAAAARPIAHPSTNYGLCSSFKMRA